MINTVFKEYAEKEFNADRNYEEILLKEKRKSSFFKKMLNTVATLLVIVVTGIMSTQIYAKIKWNIEFKEYQDRPNVEAKGTIEEAKENGYAEVINMDYITQDGISIKINSILLTDNCLDFDITFDIFEYLYSLNYLYLNGEEFGRVWVPWGEYKWRAINYTRMTNDPFNSFFAEADKLRDNWLPLKGNMFDGKYSTYTETKQKVDEFLKKIYLH